MYDKPQVFPWLSLSFLCDDLLLLLVVQKMQDSKSPKHEHKTQKNH